MGYNISGLVINKNYKEYLTELESILGEKLSFTKTVSFEEASENWKEDDYCDIYYSKNGTLVFLSMERGGFEFYAKELDTFSFVLSEMSMTFGINVVKNGKLIRTIIESEDNILQDIGEPLPIEKNEEDKSEIIYHLMENSLGKSFHDIDLEIKCYRYKFKTEESKSVDVLKVEKISKEKTELKPWWKFW